MLLSHIQEEIADQREEAVDASGIPGWDRVNDLAKALIDLDGLAVTASQAQKIEHLYNRLVDYDKQPILFHPRHQRPSRGRFARKKQSGHMSVEAMKRLLSNCFLVPHCNPWHVKLQVFSFSWVTCLPALKEPPGGGNLRAAV